MMLRRTFLLSTVAAAGAGLTARPKIALAQVPNPTELLKPGPLPEKAFGDPNAPVTVIEYASLTCHHCQNFHKTTWPALKAKYVDTGKVRFIMREFPLDPLATAGFMLARCAGEEKWYPVVDLLYTADSWAHAEKPVDALAQTMRQTGMTQAQFDACLRDEKLYQNVTETSRRGSQFGITSTPTFFINTGSATARAPNVRPRSAIRSWVSLNLLAAQAIIRLTYQDRPDTKIGRGRHEHHRPDLLQRR